MSEFKRKNYNPETSPLYELDYNRGGNVFCLFKGEEPMVSAKWVDGDWDLVKHDDTKIPPEVTLNMLRVLEEDDNEWE